MFGFDTAAGLGKLKPNIVLSGNFSCGLITGRRPKPVVSLINHRASVYFRETNDIKSVWAEVCPQIRYFKTVCA